MSRVRLAVTVLVAIGMASSAVAFAAIGGAGAVAGADDTNGDAETQTGVDELEFESDATSDELVSGLSSPASVGVAQAETNSDAGSNGVRLVEMGPTSQQEPEPEQEEGGDQEQTQSQEQTLEQEQRIAQLQEQLDDEHQQAVEEGVEGGIDLVQSQGVNVTQEQRAAAVEGALESVTQHQDADVEQVQSAVQGATHGALVQDQDVNVTQVQAAVGGSTGGALSQHQSANVTQLQSAAWGAAHGGIAQTQKQDVTVEQTQVACRGAAAGAASEAAAKGTKKVGKIQEAAQGAAYGVVEQYQKITVEQRQRITLEHVQHAAAGASAGALEGAVIEQEQRVEIEQYQRVTIKGVQKAAMGAAGGALEQRQEVSVEQTQVAARGASKGSMRQIQRVSITQVQKISITQIQEASFGAAKGAITQSQEASIEQIQAAAEGSAGGVLVQHQEVNVVQTQSAAVGAAKGAVTSAVQQQIVEVEQIQSAAFGAGEGAVTQIQIVNVVQVQMLAAGASSGALTQVQEVSVTQIQSAARGACLSTAKAVQYQRVSVTQLQELSASTATDTVAYAVEEGVEDEEQLAEFAEEDAEQKSEQVEERTGQATVTIDEQESAGETVVVESVELSEGGYVAVHDRDVMADDPVESVRGVSAYLEPGEHENVEVRLEEPLEANETLAAVAHHETSDDPERTFAYVESDGAEDDPYVGEGGSPVADSALVALEGDDEPDVEEPDAEANGTLAVEDQAGDGTNLTVDEANASVEYVLAAEYDGERVESETFGAGESVENYTLDLEPPLEENATVEVAVEAIDANETDAEDATIVNETIEYTLEEEEADEEPEPEGTLSVEDQTGNGSTLTVDEANATVDFVVAVEYGDHRVESQVVDANETLENYTLDLEPAIEANATVEVIVEAADELDSEDDVLASEWIEYTLEVEEGPEGTLFVENQTGNGSTLTVDEANATVDYVVAAEYDGERSESEIVGAGESLENYTLDLEPPLEANAAVEVTVEAVGDEADAEEAMLANETIEYTVEAEEPEPEGSLTVENQAGNGSALAVAEANASVDYVVAAEYDGERSESEVVGAGQPLENYTLDLESPLEADATVDVTVEAVGDEGADANETDAALANETIEYAVVPAHVVFEDQESDGASVVVDSAVVPDGGFVAIYDETVLQETADGQLEVVVDEGATDAVLGVSEYLEPMDVATGADVDGGGEALEIAIAGDDLEELTHENVTVDLFDESLVSGAEFDEERTLGGGEHRLVAVVHQDTTETETFEFVESGGAEDGPYVANDQPAADDAAVTVEPEFVEPEVEFLNCTAVEITGDVEGVRYTQDFYEPEGFGNVVSVPNVPWEEFADGENATILRIGPENDAWEREDGTRVVQLADQGSFGETEAGTQSILQGVELEVDDGEPEDGAEQFGEQYANPDAEQCLDQVRPDEPELTVVDAVAVDGEGGNGAGTANGGDAGGIDVTFGYDNPNDASVFVSSDFVEGTTADEPPEELEPGENEFTVRWTPEAEDEVLTWEVLLENHGYDEPIAVSTATAGEIAPMEPEFDVTVVGTNAPIEEGEPLEVTAEIANVGSGEGTQEVSLALDGEPVASAQVSLEPGQSEQVTLSAETAEGDAGDRTVEVASEDVADQTAVTIEASAEPAFLAVTDVSAPQEVTPGETITVTATIQNQGGEEATQTLSHVVDGSVSQSTDVTLAGGEAVQAQFSYAVPEGAAGSQTHVIESADDSVSVTVSIVEPEPESPEEGPPEDEEPPEEEPPEEEGPSEEEETPPADETPDEGEQNPIVTGGTVVG